MTERTEVGRIVMPVSITPLVQIGRGIEAAYGKCTMRQDGAWLIFETEVTE